MSSSRSLLVFTKPAVPGRVKTRLIGDLTAGEAAALHAAFLGDLVARLTGGDFSLKLAWALAEGEVPPQNGAGLPGAGLPAVVQRGDDLGARLYNALSAEAGSHPAVAAVGSDHPALPLALVHAAFERLEAGADAVFGPATDGGYYLVAVSAARLVPELFQGVPWSTDRVLAATLERCRQQRLVYELLPPASDVDTPADLDRLAERLAAGDLDCPRTRELLASLGRLPLAAEAER